MIVETKVIKIEHAVVKIPCYVKFSEVYMKVLNDNDVLVIDNWGFSYGIERTILAHRNPFANDGWEFITEEQFNEVHKMVSDILSEYLPK